MVTVIQGEVEKLPMPPTLLCCDFKEASICGLWKSLLLVVFLQAKHFRTLNIVPIGPAKNWTFEKILRRWKSTNRNAA